MFPGTIRFGGLLRRGAKTTREPLRFFFSPIHSRRSSVSISWLRTAFAGKNRESPHSEPGNSCGSRDREVDCGNAMAKLSIQLPRKVVIQNNKLGCCQIVLQLLVLCGVCYMLYNARAWQTQITPRGTLSYWVEAGEAYDTQVIY